MISSQQAHTILKQFSKTLPPANLPLLQCLGLVSAGEIYAPINAPPFNNSAMDGYVFRYDDFENGLPLKIQYEIQAGIKKLPSLKQAEVARIFTGAPIPDGGDTVVPQEDISIEEGVLILNKTIIKGANVRELGTQTKKGSLVLPKNTLLTAEYLGFLATLGINEIKVFPKPKVGIIVTGKELAPIGEPLKNGQIYESNSVSLQLALKQLGIEATFSIWVDDNKELIKNTIEKNASTVDVLIITGGISVGDYDFVKPALEKLQIIEYFYKIKQKPGKPLYFGALQNTSVFVLPGNPSAVVTCFHVYVKPFLKSIIGQNTFDDKRYGTLISNYQKKSGLTHFVKAVFKDKKVEILSNQLSYQMDAYSKANSFAILREKQEDFQIGEKVEVIKFTD